MFHKNGMRLGKAQPTPVPIREREIITKPIFTVEQWGPERVKEYLAEKYPRKKPKRKHERIYQWDKRKDEEKMTLIKMTKEEYLAERAAGKNRAQIANELGLKHQAYLYPTLEKWGVKSKEAEHEELRLFRAQSRTLDKPLPEAVTELKKATEEAAPTTIEAETKPSSPVVQKLVSLAELEIDSKPSSEAVEPSKEEVPSPTPKTFERLFKVEIPLSMNVLQMSFDALADDAYQIAFDKGWHKDNPHLPTQLALIHSEVSEALEADRKGFGQRQVAEELADIVIRVMDTAKSHRLDIAGALIAKMEKNKQRSFRHGNLPY